MYWNLALSKTTIKQLNHSYHPITRNNHELTLFRPNKSKISELGFDAARGFRENPQLAIKLVHAAIESGINFIDTATGDGDSERVLGQALVGHNTVLVETKCCPYDSYRQMRTMAETQKH